MSKDVKYRCDQIIFTENIIKIIGFKQLSDFNTSINYLDITGDMINLINHKMEEFKIYFNTKPFNLSRIKYTLTNSQVIFSFVKNLLDYIGMRFVIIRKENKSYLRLKNINT